MRNRRFFTLLTALTMTIIVFAQTTLNVINPETWNASALSAYVGQTVTFPCHVYICSNDGGNYKASVRRVFSPTNQALPSTDDYDNIVRLNTTATFSLNDVPTINGKIRRMGERIVDLTVKVNSTNSVTFLSGTFVGNGRADLADGPDLSIIDQNGEHNVLVCAMNCEYYLTEQFGTGSSSSMGPRDWEEHQIQRKKVGTALAIINADLYGLVEIQQGQGAIAEITADLNAVHTPQRNYKYIGDNTSANNTFTKSGFVYDANVLEPVYKTQEVTTGVSNRKFMQFFRHKASGESFIYSINHFKAKSGSGTGDNADKGDGQGSFNSERVKESKAVLSLYKTFSKQVGDEDILIMGDLNAYAKEDPITTLTKDGMVDLHRAFHADSSYSYTFRGTAGYLDHALCSNSLRAQVTGMMGYHINSDENDDYTYNGRRSDESIFRCSDHDPVLVGLRLDSTAKIDNELKINNIEVLRAGDDIQIHNAKIDGTPAYYRLYTPSGFLVESAEITSRDFTFRAPEQSGVFILIIYAGDHLVHHAKIRLY